MLVKELCAVHEGGAGGPDGRARFRIRILPGARFDIIGKIHEKAKTLFPDFVLFASQLQRRARQTCGARPPSF